MKVSSKYRVCKDANEKLLNEVFKKSEWINCFFNKKYYELLGEYSDIEKPLTKMEYKGIKITIQKAKSFYYLLKKMNQLKNC